MFPTTIHDIAQHLQGDLMGGRADPTVFLRSPMAEVRPDESAGQGEAFREAAPCMACIFKRYLVAF